MKFPIFPGSGRTPDRRGITEQRAKCKRQNAKGGRQEDSVYDAG
jgi:hypothetical protein